MHMPIILLKIDKIAGRIIRAESTGENPVPADIRINTKPNYFVNRIRVIGIKRKLLTAKNAKSKTQRKFYGPSDLAKLSDLCG